MVLSGEQIVQRMEERDPEKRLVIVPMDELVIDLTAASVDVHLGHDFLILGKSAVGAWNPVPEYCRDTADVNVEEMKPPVQEVHVPFGGEFFLHPGQFVLAAVYEYIRMPLDLCADVVGRSSWARAGLVIAMATFVHPGYCGCLTLELQNLGEVPLRLVPGLRIAQLIFRTASEIPSRPRSQIVCSMGPETAELVSREDIKLINKLCKKAASLRSWGGPPGAV